jgi:hypothetical protein
MRASGHGSRYIFRQKMTLRATVRMKRFNLEAMTGLTAWLRKSGGLVCTNEVLFSKERCLFRKAPTPVRLRFTTPAPGLDRQSHARSQPESRPLKLRTCQMLR